VRKAILISSALLFSGYFLSSCQKCRTCQYTYNTTGVDSTITFPETCDDDEDLETYEATVRAEGARNNGVVTCTDRKE